MATMPQDYECTEGLQILRPIPRRPFELNLASATPPEEDSTPPTPNINANDLRFLDPRYQGQSLSAWDDNTSSNNKNDQSLSRTASYMNLTASTLFGIYSPTATGQNRFDDRDEPPTPWGTGAMTPTRRPTLDETTRALLQQRFSSSTTQMAPAASAKSRAESAQPEQPASAASLALRAALLFGLGMGFGVLVTHLPNKQNFAAFGMEDILETGPHWEYLGLWGLAGVVLGGLLPWFDRVWEDTFGREETLAFKNPTPEKQSRPETDWALVVRGIGAFVGIAFAIRRTPWASTLQVSIALALANPFLWYLIDRSKPGFLLSVAVSVAGSAVLFGLNPDVVPTPASMSSLGSLHINGTMNRHLAHPQGFAHQESLETAMWMLSVLFCSCVCFGNIGRRLALNESAATRGRWAGVR